MPTLNQFLPSYLIRTFSRSRIGRLPARRLIIVCLAIIGLIATPLPPNAAAPSTANPLVTDKANLPLSNKFAPPGQPQLDDFGDVFFNASGLALFHWDGDSNLRTRLLQSSDPYPGFPGSVIDIVGGSLQVNGAGHAAMINQWVQAGVRSPRGVFVYNGSGFQPIALRSDPAPGTGGRLFQNFGTLGINNNDEVAFQAVFEPFGPLDQGIFLGSPTSAPVKIAATGDTAPGTGGATFLNFTLFGINSAGEVAFAANLIGGSANAGVFIGTAGSVSKVAATGDTAPGTTGAFFLQPNINFFGFNESGDVAFFSQVMGGGTTNSGIWVGDSPASLTKLVVNTDLTGTSLGGAFSNFTFRDFNNAGEVLFSSNLVGATSSHALFIKDLGNPAQVVFARNDPAPGGATEVLFNTAQASFNNAGDVAFLAQLSGGTSAYGLFQGSGAALPIKIALEGEATPVGGTFGFAGIINLPQINSSSQVTFLADILGPNAIGAFRYTPGSGIISIVNTNDTLPSGANTALRSFVPGVSDDHLFFGASLAGGRRSFFTKPLKSGNGGIKLLFSEGETAPVFGGNFWGNISFGLINNNEEVVFATNRVVGGAFYPGSIIFTHRPGFGLRKVVATGDPAPGAAGGTFFNFDIGDFGRPSTRITNAGEVAILANIVGSAGNASPTGIFIGQAGGPVNAVVRQGDPSPVVGNFAFFQFGATDLSLNEAGQIAFRANSQALPASPVGAIFVGSATAVPSKVVAQGDPGPGGSTFSMIPTQLQLNNAGQIVYVAGLTGGPAEGVFLGTAGGPQISVALTGDPAPGTGGTFSDFSNADIEVNNSGQVAFWAAVNSFAVDSGYFLDSGVAPPVARLLEGQSLPGGGASGPVASFPGALTGQAFALNDTGEMSMNVVNLIGTPNLPRLILANATGTLSLFVAPGDKAQGTGSDFGSLFQNVVANPNGRFVGTAILVDGPAKWVTFIDGKK